ncbi:hypothetical protein [Streptomyces venezuelae]|uniref:hypothetical protein n=1 Tax=Streptomyces venezuelae TaxID=54571 RepID=UPI0036323129
MSAPYERTTLAPSLHAYAKDLRAAAPDAPLPQGGLPLPEGARPPRDPAAAPVTAPAALTAREARLAVPALVRPFLTAPDPERAAVELERVLAATPARERAVFAALTAIPLPGEPAHRDRARALARCLTRHGTTVRAVAAGLGLLTRLGEPEDVPYLRTLGLLDGLGRHAVTALEGLDRQAAAVLWLVHFARGDALRRVTDALAADDGTALRERLSGLSYAPRELGPEHARCLAEALDLPALLRREPDRPELLVQALRLLTRMGSGRGYRDELRRYDDAVDLYESVAARAHELAPLLDHRARLVTLAQGLHSGPAHLLPWPPGRRRELMSLLLSAVGDTAEPGDIAAPGVVAAPGDLAAPGAVTEPGDVTAPGDRHRADWIRRAVRQLRAARPEEAAGAPRLRIEVAVADPGDPDGVETRLLVDGRPLVPVAFERGPGEPPERLLANGALRAGPEPREVRIAEAYCTEGCCGALHVTVRREGAHVVWDGWRRPGAPSGWPDLPAYRFDADAYDAEIARAERDQSWSWPARRTAWLIGAGLRERPELLTRWGLRRGWISTDHWSPETTVVTFHGPPAADGETAAGAGTEQGERQFLWYLPDDGTPPETRAEAALRRLAEEDPRGYARASG